MKMLAHSIPLFILAATLASGCAQPEDIAPPKLLLLFPVGSTATYEIGPDWSTRIPTTLAIKNEQSNWVHQYTYEGRSDLDTTIQIQLELDGSVAHAQTDCLPRAPVNGVSPCANLNSETWRIGTSGSFFGLTLFANAQLDAQTIERPIRWGQTIVNATIRVNPVGNGIYELTPNDPATRALGDADSSYFDAFGNCNVLENRVLYDIKSRLPTACLRDEERTDGGTESFGWHLINHHISPGPELEFTQSSTESASQASIGLPQESEPNLPLGLNEAIEFIKSQNAAANTLLNQPLLARDAVLTSTGRTTTGPCPACLISETWVWTLQIQADDQLLFAKVQKNISNVSPTSCNNLGACTIEELTITPHKPLPRQIPELALDISQVWNAGLSNGTPGYLRLRTTELATGEYEIWSEVHLRGSDTNFPSPHMTFTSDGQLVARFQPV